MHRLFAAACCAASLLAMAAFAAFIQNWLPKSIDTGAPPFDGGLATNLVLLAAFGVVHSLMARPAFKRALYGKQPSLDRPVYILVSALQLWMLIVWWTPMPQVLWHMDAPWPVAWYGLFLLANLLVAWAVYSIDALHFFGLRRQEPPFALKGPYRFVRHPIQTGLILALWATPHMSAGHALMAAVLSVYSIAATLGLEERDLERALGEDYRKYRDAVPALLPWRRKKMRTDP
ncbi:methyltransferase family protein [Massilia sp. SM-13]|uniref:methyltransferase family protein n=1 Tax=Pseudoduganella rhizocola TaxID=3382643 RepID=UPI0038B47C23